MCGFGLDLFVGRDVKKPSFIPVGTEHAAQHFSDVYGDLTRAGFAKKCCRDLNASERRADGNPSKSAYNFVV
jgi:hypothetical protein